MMRFTLYLLVGIPFLVLFYLGTVWMIKEILKNFKN